MTCTAKISNATCSGKVTYNVKKPTATLTTETGQVAIVSSSSLAFCYLEENDQGIIFTSTLTLPSGFSGIREWIQLVIGGTRTIKVGSIIGTLEPRGCDTTYPYNSGDNNQNAAIVTDRPFQEINSQVDEAKINNETFVMYLMFIPDGGIPVPIKKCQWFWRGTATKSGNSWIPSNFGSSVNPASTDATDFPIWDTNTTATDGWEFTSIE